MNTYTKQQWENDREFKAGAGQQIEEEIYWDMLEALPPIYSRRNTFQVGEAHSHDRNGRPLYGTFTHHGDLFFFLGYLHCDMEEINKAIDNLPI